jgi:hypothetical protein
MWHCITRAVPRTVGAVLVLGTLLPARGWAQVVRGELVDRVSGVGVAGGFVALLDSGGAEVGRTLTDAAGRFLLRAPAPGGYQLQSKRIGFRAFRSPLLTVAAGQTVDFRLEVEAIPLPLPAVVVEGKPLCGTRGDEGTLVARLWDEAREALGEVAWTVRQPYRYALDLYERGLDPYDRSIKSERSWSASGYYRTPFQSAPPDQLARQGYVVEQNRSRTFYGPDVDVLRSGAFVQTHCFSVVAGDHADSALIGLTFEPVRGHDVPDVRGTIWLDHTTSELSRVDFEYVHLPSNLPEGPGRGRVAFLRLPSGAWVVREWRIDIPILGLKPVFGRRVVRMAGVQENGGRVIRVTDRGRVLYAADLATLNGTVVDSTRGRPLAGATVSLVHTNLETTSDSAGRFQLAGSMDGGYEVTFTAPRLDSLGYAPGAVPVSLHVGTAARVTLAVPPESTIVRRLCPDSGASPASRVMLGTVRAPATAGNAAPDSVRVSWHDTTAAAPGALAEQLALMGLQTRTAAAPLDSAGRYLMCGVPVGPRLVVQALHGETPVTTATLRFAPGGVFAGDHYHSLNPGERIWRQDLEAGGAGAGTGVLAVQAVDRVSGKPIATAVVSLEGTERTAVTDHTGHAVLTNVPTGRQMLAVRRIGYQMLERVVTVPAGDTLQLGTQPLEPVPFMLDTAVVTAQTRGRWLNIVGFDARRKQGFGEFLTRPQFERYAPTTVHEVLRHMPTVYIQPNPQYGKGFPADYRKYLVVFRRTGSRLPGGVSCPVAYYLDGAYLGTDATVNVDDIVEEHDLEAVEAYSGAASTPPEFNASGSECGVLVFWTRH